MESLRALLDLSFSRSRLLVKSFSFTTGKLIVMDYGLGILRLLQLLALDWQYDLFSKAIFIHKLHLLRNLLAKSLLLLVLHTNLFKSLALNSVCLFFWGHSRRHI